jgi:hypothetical protein
MQKKFAFYRIEGENVRVIRVIDERRDIIYVLFGIKVVPDDDYWFELIFVILNQK